MIPRHDKHKRGQLLLVIFMFSSLMFVYQTISK